MRRLLSRLLAATLALMLATAGWAQGGAPTYSKERLDQLLAPIALYPDSLLTQILMAATYPAQVAEAVTWSAGHPNDKGDAAVTKAESLGWEPSVTSLVAFPQVLATMGQKPEWVQELGDAFLAQPQDTMDAVQRLRKAAQSAGMLKSNEQQTVVVQNPTPQQSVIVIQPAQPQVVYVPTYNPTVVYGAWPYPSYPPYYIPPPPGYYFGSALMTGIAFGTGLAITNALWGGYNWGRGDVDINVNRYNNINVNRQINNNQNNFVHNNAGRKGVPYRDSQVNDRYGKQVAGKDARNDYRGRDPNDARRDAARDTMAQRTNDPQTRERLQKEGAAQRPAGGVQDRQAAAGDRGGPGVDRGAAGGADRTAHAQQRPAPAGRDNALKGAGSPTERAQIDRGQASRQAAAAPRPQPSAAGAHTGSHAGSRQMSAPSRPQGGAARGGGGGGGRAGGGRGR